MSGTNGIITQVSRDGTPAQAPDNTVNYYDISPRSADDIPSENRGFFSSLCCCFGSKRKPLKAVRANTQIPVTVDEPTIYPGNDLLGEQKPEFHGKKTLVLDMDETLIHSSFKPIPSPDFIIDVVLEDATHKVFVLKRPGVDEFMKRMGEMYEVVIFTASLSKYADPLLDLLDIHKVITGRLFREHCTIYRGNYVKDLSRIGRDIKDSIIVDNSPASYLFHVPNAVPCESWFDNMEDRELLTFIPFFEQLATVDDVRPTIDEAKRKGIISR